MENFVQLHDKSFEIAGYKKDYKDAIAEYIKNSLEANATIIQINSYENLLEGIERIEIIDNGDGFSYENLSETFGRFLYSQKTELHNSSLGISNKGKGRYSFIGFANFAEWETVYSRDSQNYKHSVSLNSTQKEIYHYSDSVEKTDLPKGTKVTISGIDGLLNSSINSIEMEQNLLDIFAWYLYLNKSKDIKIIINGKELAYLKCIDTNLSETKEITIEEYSFDIHFIKWNSVIKQKYYFYFQDEYFNEKYRLHTSYNNNAIDFSHSVYIMSKYFELFEEIKNYSEEQFVINDGKKKNQSDPIFKKVLKELDKIVANKMKQFVKAESNKLIEHLEEENVFPKFTDSKYEQARKDDLVIVVKEIYCIQPKIFHKAALEQKKTVIGFLSLLLDTSERENIITIIENVTHLSSEERRELACILRKTNLSRITSTIKLLENRKDVIDLLKALVFDNYKFTSERLHIQKAIEQNYWLFGEQYHLVSADSNFEQALKEYLYIVDGEKNETKYKIANQQHLRRPDIFICQKRKTEDAIGNFIEENIIVELKSPNVVLSINTYRQIEDYMRLISKEPKFNSQTRAWKYYAICNSVDEDIKGLYSAFKDKGKRFLVYQQENHEIYAMTWDDVFNSYMITYSSLYEKLNLNIDEIEKSIGEETFPKSRDGSNSITNRIAAIG